MREPRHSPWPALPLGAWQDSYATLHMYTQIVGKLRLGLCPPENQYWHVPFYVTARGLTTSPIPYGDRTFEIHFDFIDHALVILTSDGDSRRLALVPQSVADFYAATMRALGELGIDARISDRPVEVPDPIPFTRDTAHCAYDGDAVRRFFEVLRRVDIVFKEFRGRFIGKSSPVHFFWGSFDLAVTRFSGRAAPPRPDADKITRHSYNQEVVSVGFWPGGGGVDGAAFYAYAAPEPPGFAAARVRPAAAFYHPQLKEFILRYDDVRQAADPRALILDFAESTYEA
ncbi:MAG TPA: DUF5996 family protein, partial [Polyangia bacterium]|nr:DUF5996 family protein [Polyangia bacterium]